MWYIFSLVLMFRSCHACGLIKKWFICFHLQSYRPKSKRGRQKRNTVGLYCQLKNCDIHLIACLIVTSYDLLSSLNSCFFATEILCDLLVKVQEARNHSCNKLTPAWQVPDSQHRMFLQVLIRRSHAVFQKLSPCASFGKPIHTGLFPSPKFKVTNAWILHNTQMKQCTTTCLSTRIVEQCYPTMQYQCFRRASNDGSQKKQSRIKAFHARLQEAPAPALYLGFAGLIPFVVPALFCLGSLSYSPLLAIMQVTYGATILSFLGGIHWGYSLDNKASPSNWRNLGYSVTPPLIAWVGLLMTPEFGTLMLMAGLTFAWRSDMKVKTAPSWFRALRICLSVGAIVSLGLTYTLGLIYPPPDTSTTYNWVKLMKIVKIILED